MDHPALRVSIEATAEEGDLEQIMAKTLKVCKNVKSRHTVEPNPIRYFASRSLVSI